MNPRLAWRNLWRHPRRTWLTVAAIAFSTVLLIFSITLQFGSYDIWIDHALGVYHGQLQIQHPDYLDKPQMRKTVANATGVAAKLRRDVDPRKVAVRGIGFALASSQERSYGAQVIGVEPGYEPEVSTIPNVIRDGRFLADPDAAEAVIGATLARNLKLALGDELTLLGAGRDGSVAATVVQVVGFFESGMAELDRVLVEIPLGHFQEVFTMGDAAHAIVIAGIDRSELDVQRDQITTLLGADAGARVRTWEETLPGLKQAIQFDMLQGWVLYVSLIVVVTFSILNTFLMAVLERTREFGIMLALGASPARIGALIMQESLLLTLVGLSIGVLVGLGITIYFYINGFTYPGLEEYGAEFGFPASITPEISFFSIGLAPLAILVFTLVAALYPALRIFGLRPVEAIHAV